MDSTRDRIAFLTGATGFLGLSLVEALIEAGYQVIALHRPSSDVSRLARKGVELRRGDILDPASLAAGMNGASVVFHVAGNTNQWSRRNEEQERDNVLGTRNVVEAALGAGIERLVQTSSVSVHGITEAIVDEESPLLGRTSFINYLRTKALAEDEVREGARRGLRAVSIRPGHILGRYDTGNWARMIRMIADERLPGVPSGSGCFCHGREVARAHVAAAELPSPAPAYVLGGPHATFLEVVRVIGELTGKSVPKKPLPDFVVRAVGHVQSARARFFGGEPDVTPESAALVTHHSRIDDSRAQRELGYRHTPLREMLEESHAFLHEAGLIGAP